MSELVFVCGGNDGEMMVIKSLLAAAGIRFIQPVQGWGVLEFTPTELGLEVVRESRSQIRNGNQEKYEIVIIKGDPKSVFVECQPKDWPVNDKPVIIDHHGARAGEPASLIQVIAFLTNWIAGRKLLLQDIPIREVLNFSAPTRRWIELVAANDARYIPGMLALGATPEEVERVRAFDRAAQGITPDQETEGERAVDEKEVVGRLTVVRMAHSKTATVADRLFGQHDQLLVLSGDGETNFYGDGALCAALKEKFQGWNGGSGLGKKGESAYWGGNPEHKEVLAFVRDYLSQ